MEFSTEALGQIVTDIWSSMLGFPVEARGEPAAVNGSRFTFDAARSRGHFFESPVQPSTTVTGVVDGSSRDRSTRNL